MQREVLPSFAPNCLPVEIWCEICSYFMVSGFRSLRNTCVKGRRFVYMYCCNRIRCGVNVTWPHWTLNNHLAQMVVANPAMVSNVTHITVPAGLHKDTFKSNSAPFPVCPNVTELTLVRSGTHVLDFFPSTTHLTAIGCKTTHTKLPSLTSIVCHNHHEAGPLTWITPNNDLRRLEVWNPDGETMPDSKTEADMLSLCPFLETLTLHLHHPHSVPDMPMLRRFSGNGDQLWTLGDAPHLEYLRLSHATNVCLPSWLPNLREIVLRGNHSDIPWYPLLQCVRLQFTQLYSADVMKTLEVLRELHMHIHDSTHPIDVHCSSSLQELWITGKGLVSIKHPVPSLRILSCYGLTRRSYDNIPWDSLHTLTMCEMAGELPRYQGLQRIYWGQTMNRLVHLTINGTGVRDLPVLPMLETLDCSNSSVIQVEPMPHLRQLIATKAQLQGTLEEFPKLYQLEIRENFITCIKHMPELVVLDATKNILLHITDCPKLQCAHLDDNHIAQLGCFPELQFLSISYNPIKHISDLPELRKLNCNHHSLSALANFPKLAELWCENGSLETLTNCPELHLIFAKENMLTTIPRTTEIAMVQYNRICELSDLPGLRELDVSYNPITFINLPWLTCLNARNTPLARVGQFTSLRHGFFDRTMLATLPTLPRLLELTAMGTMLSEFPYIPRCHHAIFHRSMNEIIPTSKITTMPEMFIQTFINKHLFLPHDLSDCFLIRNKTVADGEVRSWGGNFAPHLRPKCHIHCAAKALFVAPNPCTHINRRARNWMTNRHACGPHLPLWTNDSDDDDSEDEADDAEAVGTSTNSNASGSDDGDNYSDEEEDFDDGL
jgi:Leucine-rich repeat (LRR) protein